MRPIQRRDFLGTCSAGVIGAAMLKQGQPAHGEALAERSGRKTFVSGREDGRFVDTAGFVHAYIKSHKPKLAFDPDMDAREFPVWRERLCQKVLELMAFPEVVPQPPPKRIKVEQRDGYQLQRWEAYPEPFSVVPFLMLVPDGTSTQSPAPAVMCFPGSSGSKESLAGEPELNNRKLKWSERKRRDNSFGLHYVRQGMIAVAIDNPTGAEAGSALRGRAEISRCMILAGRNYLGISVFHKTQILKWLAQQSYVDADRIATCGLSLGSDPADIVGLLNPDLIKAVIHNDFLCDWREQTIAMNAYAATAWHVVPGMYAWFDAPDIQAALAPRFLLYTEGGRTPHINRVRAAYKMQGAPDNVKVYYYKKYATADLRPHDDKPIPEGLTQNEYLLYANVDVADHRFHPEHAVPWLTGVFGIKAD
jgi:alpha/beta hydrolase family protein